MKSKVRSSFSWFLSILLVLTMMPAMALTAYADASATVNNVEVAGYVGTAITPEDVEITLVGGEKFEAILADTDVHTWFTNLPAGLTAAIKTGSAVAENATTATVTIAGTPEATLSAPMTITIPAASLKGSSALTVTANDDAKFTIAAPTATVADVTIEGTTGTAITDTSVALSLQHESFGAISADTDVASWFTNLPAGLTAKVATVVSAGATAATVTISGTPTAASSEAMAILIPHDVVSGSLDVAATTNTNAKFVITSPSSGTSGGGGRTSGGNAATNTTPTTTPTETPVTTPTEVVNPTPTTTPTDSSKATVAGFNDVTADKYYAEPVRWAVSSGITKGTSATEFEPNASCTRGQMVTFMWRAEGCPEPAATTTGFTDVKSDAYYAKAVQWAVERGITNGLTATSFGPDETVDRGQTVTFLYRANGGSLGTSSSGFADVDPGAYYAEAVGWAAATGITTGTTASTFAPSDDCNRAQIVTFLYRANN